MIEALIGDPFETTFTAGETGLSPQYRIDDNEGNTVIAASAAVIELGSSGVYSAIPKPTAPGTAGQWTIIWSPDGSFDSVTNATDDLVTYTGTVPVPPVPPLAPIGGDGVGGGGPCQAWTDSESVAACCESTESSSDFDDDVVAASQVLFQLVPRFTGTCGPTRVRPCGSPCGIPWVAGWSWAGDGWLARGERPGLRFGCGCSPLSRVKLSGRVRTVSEVTIDGLIIPPASYRVDEHLWLTRIDGDSWPSCQDMTLAETEDGTFSVLYTYGVDPPVAAQYAAQELACAIHTVKCGGVGADDCPLPNNVTRVERQGITLDLSAFTSWGWDPTLRRWMTGMPMVDMFLNAYNPQGRRKRRSTAWSPDMEQYAKKLGP